MAIRARTLFKQEKKKAKNFLTKLDRNRFTSLLDELANDLSKDINYYPANIIEAMQLAQTYRADGKVIGDMTTSNREYPKTAYVTSIYKSGNHKYNQNKRISPHEDREAFFPEKSPKASVASVKSLGAGKCFPSLARSSKVSKEIKNKQNESGTEKAAVSKSEKKNKENI